MPTRRSYAFGGGGIELPLHRELPEDYIAVNVDPILMAGADDILWNPGGAATEVYNVEFLIVNVTNVAVTVSIGVDLAGGGGLAAVEYWMYNDIVPFPGNSGWRGSFTIDGDDDVRGWCVTGANLANVQWRIRRLW